MMKRALLLSLRDFGEGRLDVRLDGELRALFDELRANCLAALRLSPAFQRAAERGDLAWLYDIALDAGLDDFGETIGCCGDDGEARCERFEAGVGEWFVERGEDKCVGYRE